MGRLQGREQRRGRLLRRGLLQHGIREKRVEPKDLQFTEAVRGRNGSEVDICSRCEESHEIEQFRASSAKMTKGGRFYSEPLAESAEAGATAEADVEGLAQGFAMAPRTNDGCLWTARASLVKLGFAPCGRPYLGTTRGISHRLRRVLPDRATWRRDRCGASGTQGEERCPGRRRTMRHGLRDQ